jgi:hypothetical protein
MRIFTSIKVIEEPLASAGKFRWALFLAALALIVWAPRANAQTVYGYSSLYIGASYVTSDSETDLDYYAEMYYDVETDAYLYSNGYLATSGSSGGSVGLEVPTYVDTSYEIQTNHWIIAVAESPYCFSCVGSAGWYSGSLSVTGDWEWDDGDGDEGSVYIGTTWAEGDTDGSPPSITGVDNTTYGNELRGTSGYVILYGSNFTTPYGSTSESFGFGYATYVSQTQINLYYSIPLDTDSGTYSGDIGVSTPYGSTSTNFYVYDPTPTITSMSSSSWNAGSVYSGFTISGAGFGSSPSVSFSDSYISFSPSSAGDTSITGTLTVGSGDPGGPVTVTVAADAWGGGSFFQAGGGGGGSATSGVSVTPLPPSLSCPASVTRAGNITCQVSYATAGRITAWQFADDNGGTVSGSAGSTSWSGMMVVSGTISVTVSGYGRISTGVTVNPRSGWQTSPASPAQVGDGTLIWTGSTATPLPSPPTAGEFVGFYNLISAPIAAYATVASGPNQGYLYITSVSYPSLSNYFQWELAADVANSTSIFSTKQCGTNGYISYSNLLADTTRHEAGQVAQSHWINYSYSVNANNFGTWVEPQTAQPGTATATFTNPISVKISDLGTQIRNDAAVEPYGVQQDINGNFQGYVNYAPYTSNTCP